jgi:hypothetical protein
VGPQSYAAAGAELPFELDELEEPDGSLEEPPDVPPPPPPPPSDELDELDELGFALVSPDDLSDEDLSPVGLSPDGLFEGEL